MGFESGSGGSGHGTYSPPIPLSDVTGGPELQSQADDASSGISGLRTDVVNAQDSANTAQNNATTALSEADSLFDSTGIAAVYSIEVAQELLVAGPLGIATNSVVPTLAKLQVGDTTPADINLQWGLYVYDATYTRVGFDSGIGNCGFEMLNQGGRTWFLGLNGTDSFTFLSITTNALVLALDNQTNAVTTANNTLDDGAGEASFAGSVTVTGQVKNAFIETSDTSSLPSAASNTGRTFFNTDTGLLTTSNGTTWS